MAPKDPVLAMLATFRDLDIPRNLSLRTPDCTWHMAPASCGFPPGSGPAGGKTNAEHEQHLRSIKGVLDAFPVTPIEVWEARNTDDEAAKRGEYWVVTVWARSEAVFKEEVKGDDPSVDWTFHNEYMFVVTVDESGEKISRVVEFLDSFRVKEVQKLLALAQENLARKAAAQA